MNWIIVTAILCAGLFAIGYFLAKGRVDGISFGAHRERVVAISLIVVALGLINWLCSAIGWNWWRNTWDNHVTLFWLTQFAIVFACSVFLASENSFAKGFAKLLIAISILGWFTVNSFSVGDLIPDPTPKVVVTRVLILKGDVKEFRLDDIVTMDDLPTTLYRVNKQGQFKERKFGEPWNLPRHTNTIEFQATQDLVVQVRELHR